MEEGVSLLFRIMVGGVLKYRAMNSISKYHAKKTKKLGVKEKITMQPCDELTHIVLQHHGTFHTGEQIHSIEDAYSRQEKGAWKMVHLHNSIAVPNESIAM